jgi:hypothetical protein
MMGVHTLVFHRHFGSRLPARREWPHRYRTAEQRDEVAAFPLIELHALPPACAGLEDTDFEAVSQGHANHSATGCTAHPRSPVGQNQRLPQRNIDGRFTSINRHWWATTRVTSNTKNLVTFHLEIAGSAQSYISRSSGPMT